MLLPASHRFGLTANLAAATVGLLLATACSRDTRNRSGSAQNTPGLSTANQTSGTTLEPDETSADVSAEERQTGASEACTPPTTETRVRKKTNSEIRFSLEDLTGYSFEEAALLLPANPGSATFPAVSGPSAWDQNAAEKLVSFAEHVAVRLQRDEPFLTRYGIDLSLLTAESTSLFVERVAQMFLGGGATPELIRSLSQEFDTSEADERERFYAGIRAVVFRLILDPLFLYEAYPGNGPDALWTARRLALAIWRSVPDRTLLINAEAGAFQTEGGLVAEVKRMLADPKAQRAFQGFAREWLATDALSNAQRSATSFPQFSAELVAALDQDLLSHVTENIFQKDTSLSGLLATAMTHALLPVADLLTTDNTQASGSSAPAKKSSEARASSQPVSVPENRRRTGILAHPALATLLSVGDEPNAVKRSTYVLKRFLCVSLPPPPADGGVFKTTDLPANATTRERFAAHATNASCASCHSLLDGVGFAMEQYDALGQFRTHYPSGREIDASGSLALGDRTLTFEGVDELQSELIEKARDQIDACLVEQIAENALRAPASGAHSCAAENILRKNGPKGFRSTLLELILQPAFWTR